MQNSNIQKEGFTSGQPSQGVDWRTVVVFVSIAFSSQCGGGFASGSTPWSYFFRNTGFYGMLPVVAQPYFCLFMPFVVAGINCFMIYFFMKFAMDFRVFDYSNFLRKYGSRFCRGIFAKPMQVVYELNFNWLLIVCMALAYSTSGSALSELTGIPYLVTTLIVGAIMFLLCMKGASLVRKNAVFMSGVIFVALVLVHVPNILFNLSSGKLGAEMAVMKGEMEAGIASGAGSVASYLLIAVVWAYIFSGQNLAGFGAYVNHAQLFQDKRTLRWAVVLSVIANWAFLAMNVVNLAANYSAVYDGWAEGKAVYTILVVQEGTGSKGVKTLMLTLLTIAIFFATISTAINYAQGFNDRVLNWYQDRIKEEPAVSEAKRNKRGALLTFLYICLTWGVSQAGLTSLVSKGLTLASYITLFTLIIPTIFNVVIGWKDGENIPGRP